jgi:hypothetical protein
MNVAPTSRPARPPKLVRRLTRLRNRLLLHARWLWKSPGRPHGRQTPVIVSLTSYPARFATLDLTLKSLLLQSVQPDRLILWIAHEDAAQLPRAVTSLTPYGLDIRFCENWRSFKKIIPALAEFPEADIVTADDDIYYWREWLEELIEASERHPRDVIAHRVHEITTDGDGNLRPYGQWHKKRNNVEASAHNFATGVAGVYYPAGCFHSDVLNAPQFMRLCPAADDVWLYWMVRMNGRFERHSGTRQDVMPWRGTQKSALWKINKSANDAQIEAMVEAYGLPW